MKRALIISNQDEKISNIISNLDDIIEKAEQRALFFKKQMDNLVESTQTQKDKAWEEMEVRLKELNLLPADYSKDVHVLKKEENAIFIMTKEEMRKEQLGPLAGLLGGIIKV